MAHEHNTSGMWSLSTWTLAQAPPLPQPCLNTWNLGATESSVRWLKDAFSQALISSWEATLLSNFLPNMLNVVVSLHPLPALRGWMLDFLSFSGKPKM